MICFSDQEVAMLGRLYLFNGWQCDYRNIMEDNDIKILAKMSLAERSNLIERMKAVGIHLRDEHKFLQEHVGLI
jgi:hypothetical protein